MAMTNPHAGWRKAWQRVILVGSLVASLLFMSVGAQEGRQSPSLPSPRPLPQNPLPKVQSQTTQPPVETPSTSKPATETSTPTTTPPPETPQQTTPAEPASPSTPAPSSPAPTRSSGTNAAAPVASDGDEEVIRVSSNLVVVPVSVTDPDEQPVQNLMAADFRLEEEGRVQTVETRDPDQVPLELALLLDVSGSVRERFAFEQEAAARFLKSVMKPIDRTTIYAIDRGARLVESRATVDVATGKLMQLTPTRDPTAFFDTVVEAARYLARSSPPRHRRVIVIISDGEDTFSTPEFKTVEPAIREVQRAEAVIYTINPTGNSLWLNKISQRGQEGMRKLAEASGGATFVPDVLEDLDRVFRQITAELRSQYLLQYYSNNNASPGKFLKIKVNVPKRSELRIRNRQGYYAATRKQP